MRKATVWLVLAGCLAHPAPAAAEPWAEELIGGQYVLKQTLKQFKGAQLAMVGYDCVTGVSRFMFATNAPVRGKAEVHQHYEMKTYPRSGTLISMDGMTFVAFAGKNAEWLKGPFMQQLDGMPYGFDISLTAKGSAQVVQGEGFAEKFKTFVKTCPEKPLAANATEPRTDSAPQRPAPKSQAKGPDASACAPWGQVQVNGVASRRTFADADGRPEKAIILEIETPICFQKGADDWSPALPPQKLAHLIGSNASKVPLGKKLSIIGYAGHSETAHHHASVIIDNFQIAPYEDLSGGYRD